MSISHRMKNVRFEIHTRHNNEFHHTSIDVHTYRGIRVYTISGVCLFIGILIGIGNWGERTFPNRLPFDEIGVYGLDLLDDVRRM